MTQRTNVEEELADFNLDRMSPAGKANLLKVAELMGALDFDGWHDYIDNSALDLKGIAKELEISRSSLYQNEHIKRYILSKAQYLMEQGVIGELPYQARTDGRETNDKSFDRYNNADKVIQEKNTEIKRLQLKVAELSANLDGVKLELKKVKQDLERSDTRSRHLSQFGRMPR